MRRLALPLIVLLLTAACSKPADETTQAPAAEPPAAAAPAPEPKPEPPAPPKTARTSLCDGDWVLASLKNDGDVIALDAETRPTLGCMPENKVGGNATINRYFGGADIGSNGSIQWAGPGFGSTMMAGPEALMKQEVAYLAALHQSDNYRIEGEQLILTGGGGVELVFDAAN